MLEVRYDKWPSFTDEFGHMFYKDPFSLLPPRRRVPVRRSAGDDGADRSRLGDSKQRADDPCRRAPKTMLKDQDFPISIEVQLLGGLSDGKPRSTANLCTPGTNVVMNGELQLRIARTRSRRRTTATSGCAWRSWCTATSSSATWSRERRCSSTRSRRSAAAGEPDGSRRQGRRHAADGRIHLAPGGDGADRLPEGRAPQSRGVHGSESEELQELLRQIESGDVQVSGRVAEGLLLSAAPPPRLRR